MKLKAILLTLSLLIIILVATGGIFYYQTAKSAAIQQNHFATANILTKSAENITTNISNDRAALRRLAANVPLQAALRDPTPATLAAANQTLASFNSAFHAGIFYLLDAQGNTIASSNQGTPGSFVDHNYGFRPYFREAIQGRPTTFLGQGVTSGEPGIYQSHPLYSPEDNRIIGVIVGKFFPADILGEINNDYYRGLVALTSPADIIFLCNQPELNGNFLWETSAVDRQKLADARQFGPGPWPWSGFRKIDATKAVDREGHEFALHEANIGALTGWHLLFLHDNTSFAAELSATLTREIGTTLGLALLVFSLLVITLYVMATEEITQRRQAEDKLRAYQQHLERLIEERTAQISDTNRELQREIEAHKTDAGKLEYSNKSLAILNKVLQISQEARPLPEFLNEFLKYASSFAELGLLPKGALFLVEKEQPHVLRLTAHYNLSDPLPEICNQVAFGRCLCGRAAETGKIIFADQIDERHENTYAGIHPHGHYCVPILARDHAVLGVYNVYTRNLVSRDPRVEKLLNSVAAVLGNIIEYKNAEAKIRENHAKYRAITDTANDSIVMINHLGLISFWNLAAEKIFGFTTAEALGQKLHDLITPERFRAAAATGFAQFLKTGQGPIIGKTVEMLARHKSGANFPIELSISALRQGQHWAAVAIIRDITERKTSEAEKLKMEQQLQHAQKMEAIGTLAAGIAHDFNNILSSILGYAELVRDDMPPTCTESLDDLTQVIKAGNRAKELVKQIMTFSSQTEDEAFPIQISLVIKEALKLLRASLPANIEIKQMISANSATIMCNPSHIHQIIMNLCTNSYRAMRADGGVLEVRLDSFTSDPAFAEHHPELSAGEYLCLTVRDTGYGIAPAILPRIFDPYFSTNKKEDGTGLGLAVVHGLVAKMRGAIEVESEPGQGATFKVFFPKAKTFIEPRITPSIAEIRGSETILLVDDELPLLQLEERMLTSLGYKTVCRTSSIEAMELFRNQPDRFDLVVTDHSMPNMTGAKLAEVMVDIRPDIPIILCTGYSELDISADVKNRCIREIVMKPVNKKELALAIRRLLGHGKSDNIQD
jgi:PAS domain S-box-containing protein